ncbi:cysteine dioxygenase [Coleofasciculus sp.]|uniref:cysteine dioxygenase n=1 Tax=Coleofasciculus sp. TaxID=3100458 RepID=UPI0039F85BC8
MPLTNNLADSSALSIYQKIKNNENIPVFQILKETENQLILKGQGTVAVSTINNREFSIYLSASATEFFPGYALTVNQQKATFYRCEQGNQLIELKSESGVGLDSEEKCWYWFSIEKIQCSLDSINCRLRYGKGEQRELNILMEYTLDDCTASESWIEDIKHIHLNPIDIKVGEIWRDPVTIEPPLLIFPRDTITIEMAATYKGTVVENLTSECQKLYANVAGKQFQLNTPDFPYFSEAIEQSIQNPKGWCYQTLKSKEKEFGEPNPDATYLRITLGVNQGESPGIPYVLEIWPNGHYSPIHNHAKANAVIKVLHGEISVRLFDMLSVSHTTPFKTATIKEGDITWITPRLNQTHQLRNENLHTVCVTVQCYLYNLEDNFHYECFDYIDNGGKDIKRFLPNSDMDFLAFKEQMKKEWESSK